MISAPSARPAVWILAALLSPAAQGDGESIMIDPASGRRIGAADPRKPDARAVGY
jgi:hypothetical protein